MEILAVTFRPSGAVFKAGTVVFSRFFQEFARYADHTFAKESSSDGP